jgi:hypothetical protein
MIDLNGWYGSLNRVSGSMALRFCKATAADLQSWAKALRAAADEMDIAAAPATHQNGYIDGLAKALELTQAVRARATPDQVLIIDMLLEDLELERNY